MKIKLNHKFEDVVSVNNLLLAWQGFVGGKRNKPDVQLFQFNLIGLPLGNLISQLFANVYLNEFDQSVKHVKFVFGIAKTRQRGKNNQ